MEARRGRHSSHHSVGRAATPQAVASPDMRRAEVATIRSMPSAASHPAVHRLSVIFGWRRLVVALGAAALVGLVISGGYPTSSTANIIAREMVVALSALLMFGIFEHWPARLPRWLARW